MHAPSWEGVYSEILKVLKPGGVVCIFSYPYTLVLMLSFQLSHCTDWSLRDNNNCTSKILTFLE